MKKLTVDTVALTPVLVHVDRLQRLAPGEDDGVVLVVGLPLPH